MTDPRTWILIIPAPAPWLTSNHSGHTIAIGRLIKPWREAAYWAARQAKLPVGLDRVRIDIEARFRGRAPVRDRMNLYPTVKAVVDGLGPARQGVRYNALGWGLIPDDDDRHLDGPHLTIGPKLPDAVRGTVGQITITITDISVAQLDETAQLRATIEQLRRELDASNAAGRILARDLAQRDKRIETLEGDLARLRMVRG